MIWGKPAASGGVGIGLDMVRTVGLWPEPLSGIVSFCGVFFSQTKGMMKDQGMGSARWEMDFCAGTRGPWPPLVLCGLTSTMHDAWVDVADTKCYLGIFQILWGFSPNVLNSELQRWPWRSGCGAEAKCSSAGEAKRGTFGFGWRAAYQLKSIENQWLTFLLGKLLGTAMRPGELDQECRYLHSGNSGSHWRGRRWEPSATTCHFWEALNSGIPLQGFEKREEQSRQHQ